MRVARMPFCSWDRTNGKAVINRRFPKDVQALTGEWYRFRYSKSISYAVAKELSAERLIEFNAIVENARARLSTPEGMNGLLVAIGERAASTRESLRLIREEIFPVMDGLTARYRDEAAFVRQANRFGHEIKIADAHEVVTTESVLNLWIAEVLAEKKAPPPKPAVVRKRSVMERMFAHLGKPDDLAGLTLADLQRYKDHLMGVPGRVAYDHLTDITQLYRVADRNNRFDGLAKGNPAAKIKVPAKPDHAKRPPFPVGDARRILIDARSRPDPIIRWGHWLSAFMGLIQSELVQAHSDCFYRIGDRLFFDMEKNKRYKSPYRLRLIPVHPAIIQEGFENFLETRKGQMLFDVTAEKAVDLLGAHIRNLGIKGRDRVFYCWRHGVTTELGESDCARFLTGHAPIDVHARHYQHWRTKPDMLIAAIDGLPDPSA